jgi:hypothetical protein
VILLIIELPDGWDVFYTVTFGHERKRRIESVGLLFAQILLVGKVILLGMSSFTFRYFWTRGNDGDGYLSWSLINLTYL